MGSIITIDLIPLCAIAITFAIGVGYWLFTTKPKIVLLMDWNCWKQGWGLKAFPMTQCVFNCNICGKKHTATTFVGDIVVEPVCLQ